LFLHIAIQSINRANNQTYKLSSANDNWNSQCTRVNLLNSWTAFSRPISTLCVDATRGGTSYRIHTRERILTFATRVSGVDEALKRTVRTHAHTSLTRRPAEFI